jgi:hypothetical protein
MLFLVAVNASAKWAVVLVAALGASAGCGERSPIEPGLVGSPGQGVAGHGGVGQDGGGGSAPSCGPNSVAVYCPDCNGGRAFVRCSDPGALEACPNRCLPPSPCSGLKASCTATVGCTAQICATCNGQSAFETCYPSEDPPPVCIPLPCVPLPECSTLDATSCKGRSDCQPNYCCGGNVYGGCGTAGAAFTCMTSCPALGPCSALDETTCKGRSDCTAGYCPDCMGGQNFAGCSAPGDRIGCGPCPPICDNLDETSCMGTGGCMPKYCPSCSGSQTFVGCIGPGVAAARCPPLACPQPAPCAEATTQTACDVRADCHSVFGKCLTCDCLPPACLVGFVKCADGGKASCMGPLTCQTAPPDCSSTTTTTYVVSYAAGCYEGCVRPSECGALGLQ